MIELHHIFEEQNFKLLREISNEGVKWYFIPPRVPHFGGIWKPAVKSTKQLLKRVAGNALLASHKFNTLVIKIDAVLNTSSLTHITSGPQDLTSLTS